MTTAAIASSDLFSKVSGNNIQNAQIGDCMNRSSANLTRHVVLITDLEKDSNGKITKVEISEQTSPKARTVTYTAEEVKSKFTGNGYTLLRFKNRSKVAAPDSVSGWLNRVIIKSWSGKRNDKDSQKSDITIKWTAVSGAKTYRVERRIRGTDTNYEVVKSDLSSSTTSYTDTTGLQAGKVYYYRVYAVNSSGDSSPKVDGFRVYTAPVVTSVNAAGTTSAALKWNSLYEAKYKITRRKDSDTDYREIKNGITSNTFTDTGLEVGTKYWYRVYAYNDGGSSTSVASYSVTTKNQYRIAYNANGGSGSPAAQTKVQGTNLTLSAVKPTRPGYAFKGWAASATAVTAQYQPGGTYSADSAATLYAVWKGNMLTMRYNANGGVVGSNNGGFSASATGAIQKNGSDVITAVAYGDGQALSQYGLWNALSFGLTRKGYRFEGWSMSADGSTTIFGEDDTTLRGETIYPNLRNGDAEVVMYAIWEREQLSPDLVLPAGLKTIGEESFAGLTVSTVECPEGLEEIEARAFAGCTNLTDIYIPESVTVIAGDAFEGCVNLTIWGIMGTEAERYARDGGMGFESVR